jgi:hypothetical protein
MDLVDRKLARNSSESQPRTWFVLAQHPGVVPAVLCQQQVVDHRRHGAVAPEVLAAIEELGCVGEHLDDHRRVGDDVGPVADKLRLPTDHEDVGVVGG